MVKPLSIDDEGDAVLLGLNAAASALHMSAVPWMGPVAGVRVALVDDKVSTLTPCFFTDSFTFVTVGVWWIFCLGLSRPRLLNLLISSTLSVAALMLR